MSEKIIGRKKELEILNDVLSSESAEFIAIYGRRRIGKTYLIKTFFSNSAGIFFEQTGNDSDIKSQLKNFSESLSKAFYKNLEVATQKTWMDAFRQLNTAIESTPKNKRITIFFDELPWLATRKSGFLKALEYYWNTQWSNRRKLVLIVCGSAASWMIKKIVYAKGGLHNRITVTIPLQPFSLSETHSYLNYRGNQFNEQQTLQIYMVMGGVPHYLKHIKKNLSVSQNINSLCFQKNGFLLDEFSKLFHSLYEEPDTYIKIITAISKKRGGISREELIHSIKNISDGGTLNIKLQSLEEAGFISKFLPLGHSRRGIYYKLIDEYTIFYLKWIASYKNKNRPTSKDSHWTSIMRSSAWDSWSGYAFEAVCLKHIDIIKTALRIDTIQSYCGDWRYTPKNGGFGGTQIDLLFDREDDCIILCEIKNTDKEFVITKDYADELERKKSIYKEITRTKKQIIWCLITSNGIVKNSYYKNLISHAITLKDLYN
jgi:AAA+ ATPase superfamily predicted ATPase